MSKKKKTPKAPKLLGPTAPRDLDRYRPNVGVVLFAAAGHVLIGRRVGETGDHIWQLPQGGIDKGESAEAAAMRELEEETGVASRLIEPLDSIDAWLAYDFPPEMLARNRKGRDWLGQKQRWFAYRFLGVDTDVQLDAHRPPEFDAWRWENLTRTPELIIPWKRPVYDEVVRTFARHAAKD